MFPWIGSVALLLTPTLAHAAGPEPASAPAQADDAKAGDAAKTETSLPESALTYHRKRTAFGLAGLGTLTGWAAINLVVGTTGFFTTTGSIRSFHQGNAAFNSVNLAIGIVGLVRHRRERRSPVAMDVGISRARLTQQTWGVALGFDMLYIGTGVILWHLGNARDSAPALGYGQSLVLQGSFVFAFDTAMMLGHELLIRRFARDDARARSSFRLSPLVSRGQPGEWVTGLALRLR